MTPFSMTPNGITTSYAYDEAYRLTAIVAKNAQNQILDAWSYQYDAAGNRTSKTGLDGKAEVYGYDTVDRLTSATYTDGSSETFTYDAVGNRLTKSDQNGITTSSSYDLANELLTAGTDALTYDNNGNMLRKVTASGTTTVTYTPRNLPLTISAPDGTETNAYGPNGERTYLMSPQAAGYAEYPQYDLAGNPIAEVMGSNFLWQLRIYRVYGPGVDEPLAEWKDGQPINYLHHDALGSVTLATDSNATPLYGRTYSAFGTPTAKAYASTNYWQTRLGYTSRENGVGGLVGYRSRTYDPAYGRFLERDQQVGDDTSAPSLHKYTYTLNNPVRYVDPSGNAPMMTEAVLWGVDFFAIFLMVSNPVTELGMWLALGALAVAVPLNIAFIMINSSLTPKSKLLVFSLWLLKWGLAVLAAKWIETFPAALLGGTQVETILRMILLTLIVEAVGFVAEANFEYDLEKNDEFDEFQAAWSYAWLHK